MDDIQNITQGMHELKFGEMAGSFPQEIIQEILIRLPVKSLIKSTSVCKTWRSMIINPRFIRTHVSPAVQFANQNDIHLLLHRVSGLQMTTFFGQTVMYKNFQLLPGRKHNSYIRVVGICDGLFCLADDMFRYCYNFFIWNPAIRKLVTIPWPNVRFDTHAGYDASIGFGFDAMTNNYKVVRVVTLLDQRGTPTLAEVYSLATGTWTSLGCVSPTCLTDGRASSVFFNGVLHWPVFCKTNGDLYYFILTFHLGKEVFRKMPMPKIIKWKFDLGMQLSVSDNRKSIALFTMDNRFEDSFLEIWVMKEYGIKESWTKLITLGPEGPERLLPRALWFRKSGEVLVLLTDKSRQELVSLDLESKQASSYSTRVMQSLTKRKNRFVVP
ncbi:F-box protein CPR30 [Prunus yedoensis var. nudiflora]|uniref:F-box protein CPR30 n=1 Tax=Prunus yedoensis var. nudiflora TaxID=2094558 RepID=A0A314Y2N7_PRUYE|nr:F-box protein CPR30 [Prunus yedoensis var. nudiflora]